MFEPLNEELYRRVTQVFKQVQVVKKSIASGVRAKKNIFFSPGKARTKFSPQSPYEIVYGDWGETYSVCCPKCGDTRFRLHISHMWNVELQPGLVTRNLVKCFNEDCDWRDLDLHLSKGKLEGGLKPVNPQSINKSVSRPARVMKLPSHPENIHFLSELADSHPAVIYAKSRGLDPQLVSRIYGVSFCSKSNWKTPVKDSSGKVWYVSPEDRLILPNLDADGSWNGWQARWIGGFRYSDDVRTWDKVPRDPSKGNEILPKYLTAPGMMAKATVFNVGRAASLTGGKLCFVNEGPVSAIASGPCGVCTFGMRMSQVQIDTLAKHFSKGRIIILKESEDDPTESCNALNKLVAGGCHIVTLPPKTDAADLGFEKTLELIHETVGSKL